MRKDERNYMILCVMQVIVMPIFCYYFNKWFGDTEFAIKYEHELFWAYFIQLCAWICWFGFADDETYGKSGWKVYAEIVGKSREDRVAHLQKLIREQEDIHK